jgi:exo-beta-1,3-glucanase (GH17 family)
MVSELKILEDLLLLTNNVHNFNYIRIWDKNTKLLDLIKDHNLNIKVQIALWWNGQTKIQFAYWNVLQTLLSVANDDKYKDIICAISIGNERLANWSFSSGLSPKDGSDLIKYVRNNTKIPITYNYLHTSILYGGKDGYLGFTNAPYPEENYIEMFGLCDFVNVHLYPYWSASINLLDEYMNFEKTAGYTREFDFIHLNESTDKRAQATMDTMLTYISNTYTDIVNHLESKNIYTKIIIGETGWKTHGLEGNLNTIQKCLTNQYFQAYYFSNIENIVYNELNTFMFYFNSFDEKWKENTGDDGWGLWTDDAPTRKPKLALTKFNDFKSENIPNLSVWNKVPYFTSEPNWEQDTHLPLFTNDQFQSNNSDEYWKKDYQYLDDNSNYT